MDKRIFQFRMPDGSTGTTDNIYDEGVNTELRLQHLQAFYESEKITERIWRNDELTATDWCLIEDATYAGNLLKGSTELAEIKAYRQALREYNLTTDVRPERPEWFIQ